jgi:hypothetical protein
MKCIRMDMSVLFINALGSSIYKASSDRIIREKQIGKDLEGA